MRSACSKRRLKSLRSPLIPEPWPIAPSLCARKFQRAGRIRSAVMRCLNFSKGLNGQGGAARMKRAGASPGADMGAAPVGACSKSAAPRKTRGSAPFRRRLVPLRLDAAGAASGQSGTWLPSSLRSRAFREMHASDPSLLKPPKCCWHFRLHCSLKRSLH